MFSLSEKRDSNPRPQPWQGCALPTELFSRLRCKGMTIFCSLQIFRSILTDFNNRFVTRKPHKQGYSPECAHVGAAGTSTLFFCQKKAKHTSPGGFPRKKFSLPLQCSIIPHHYHDGKTSGKLQRHAHRRRRRVATAREALL